MIDNDAKMISKFSVWILVLNLSNNFVFNERHTLALFSILNCPQGDKLQCQNAAINEKTLRKSHEKLNIPQKLCTIDVENSNQIVVEVLLDLINFYQVDFSGKCRDKSVNVRLKLEEIVIFTYVSFEMTRLISSLLMIKDIDTTLISITTEKMYPSQLLEKDIFIFSYETSFQRDVQKESVQYLKQEYNISYMAVIYFKESDKDNELVRKPCKNRPETAFCFYVDADKNNQNDCIKELFLDINDKDAVSKAMNFMVKDPHLRVLMAYGFGSTIFRFEHQAGSREYTNVNGGDFYISYFERKLTDIASLDENGKTRWGRSIINIPGEHAINEFLGYVYELTKKLVNNKWVFSALENTGVIADLAQKHENVLKLLLKDWKTGDQLSFDDWKQIPEAFRKQIAVEISQNRILIKKFIQYWKQSTYLNIVTPEDLLAMRVYSPKKALEAKPYCNMTIPRCSKGFELKHSLYKEEFWNNSYGWHCAKCPPMTYKNTKGNSECQPCIVPLQTDEARITCFDPYTAEYLQLYSLIGLTVVIVSLLNAMVILATLAAFIKHRQTPIVKHANRKMTLLHLTSHFILSAVPMALFIGKPTKITCILRPIIIGICFTVNVSVNLAKTQKLYLIFTSKTLHSQNKKRLIDAVEFMIIFIALLLDISICVISLSNRTHEVAFTLVNLDFIREVTCTSNEDIIVHLSFVLILVLANGIQAVRSRKLPSHFKETTHVIYSSFISMVVLAALATIYFLQKRSTTRNIVLAFSVLLLNAIHFGLIYSYKMYIIMFKPELNTVAVLNKRRKRKFDNIFAK
ncbi:uncharacterized protein [Clytia hemisphaerica]|uniref:uncharacterized protein n=1 Tax=Clytia hemisphaerica TaxID=252671 RepID=UPI0034D6536B